MEGFFDPNPRAQELFSMYGTGHLVLLLIVLAGIVVMAWQRDRVVRLRQNRRFMVWLSIVILAGEVQEYTMMWLHGYEPAYELLPFHLCGLLAFALPLLVLTQRYDIVRFVASWSLAAGLISFLNLGITHNSPAQLTLYHYVWKHLFLVWFPPFLFIAGDWTVSYRSYARSMAGLTLLSVPVFLVNWVFGTNYFYIGPQNEMAVPFLPDSLLQWPIIYPTFIVVGLVLFHACYAVLAIAQRVSQLHTTEPAT